MRFWDGESPWASCLLKTGTGSVSCGPKPSRSLGASSVPSVASGTSGSKSASIGWRVRASRGGNVQLALRQRRFRIATKLHYHLKRSVSLYRRSPKMSTKGEIRYLTSLPGTVDLRPWIPTFPMCRRTASETLSTVNCLTPITPGLACARCQSADQGDLVI
jgi:hypothetical protein